MSPEKKVFLRNSAEGLEYPDEGIDLVVTSPPYWNAGKTENDNLGYQDYIRMLFRVFSDCFRLLVRGGRICVNIADVGRNPYVPLSDRVADMLTLIGYTHRGRIVWNKTTGSNMANRTNWGSWKSPSNPSIRDSAEYILVFSKEAVSKKPRLPGRVADITTEEFLLYTNNVWTFPGVSDSGHPAVFPEELPYRCIKLYTWPGDVVYDPFCGTGTTLFVAERLNRAAYGCEVIKKYYERASQVML